MGVSNETLCKLNIYISQQLLDLQVKQCSLDSEKRKLFRDHIAFMQEILKDCDDNEIKSLLIAMKNVLFHAEEEWRKG